MIQKRRNVSSCDARAEPGNVVCQPGGENEVSHFPQGTVFCKVGDLTLFARYLHDGLADAIERGASVADATEIIASCARHTVAMGLFGTQPGHIDTLVLGCTHYPFVSEHLQELVGVGVALVENGEAVARQAQRLLHAAAGGIGPTVIGPGRISLITTGDAQTLKAAAVHWLALREPIKLLQL